MGIQRVFLRLTAQTHCQELTDTHIIKTLNALPRLKIAAGPPKNEWQHTEKSNFQKSHSRPRSCFLFLCSFGRLGRSIVPGSSIFYKPVTKRTDFSCTAGRLGVQPNPIAADWPALFACQLRFGLEPGHRSCWWSTDRGLDNHWSALGSHGNRCLACDQFAQYMKWYMLAACSHDQINQHTKLFCGMRHHWDTANSTGVDSQNFSRNDSQGEGWKNNMFCTFQWLFFGD